MPVRSLAEIDATGRKAARGCGCPWGLAEEAGKSARWLASHGYPGAEALADLLNARDQCCTKGGAPCALLRAAALADRNAGADGTPIDPGEDDPLLILAQMGRVADVTGDSYTVEGAFSATIAPGSLRLDDRTTAPSPASRDVAEAAWATLTHLSQRILVPATDASRAGAGAGTRDTD